MRWVMWSGENSRGFCNMDTSPRFAEMSGHPEPVEVVVTEDPDGTFYGWVQAEGPYYGGGVPTMIQPARFLFDMQFPAGAQAEVDHGKGSIVRLRVERRNLAEEVASTDGLL